jgi:16S rRNA (guanine966-N2)-methyltransferase
MRVISGSAKGTRLSPVPGRQTRPISDRVKQSLFDILADSTIGSCVLDLFAGSGSVGIEALSRGAAFAVFVEHHGHAISTIRENLQRARLSAQSQVIRSDVFRFLSGPSPQPFDLVYVAPPQYLGLWAKTLRALDAHCGWLSPNGLIVVQIFPKEFETLTLASLQLADRRRVGSTLLCFYEPSPAHGKSVKETQT